MATSQEVSQPDYWDAIYREEPSPGWNLGKVAPPLAHWLANTDQHEGRALVPGCGYGYDAIGLAKAGYQTTGVDFSELAMTKAHENAASAGVEVDFQQRDLFNTDGFENAFDLVYEYTCFVAIHPSRREEYRDVMATVLKPGGKLIGCFYNHGRDGGPPFDTNRDDVQQLFESAFDIRVLETSPHSIERRMGKELWAEFIRR